MLVLKRKEGECIVINNDIRVRVIRLCGGAVRLGIEAPEDVRIMREELCGRAEPVAAVQPVHPAGTIS